MIICTVLDQNECVKKEYQKSKYCKWSIQQCHYTLNKNNCDPHYVPMVMPGRVILNRLLQWDNSTDFLTNILFLHQDTLTLSTQGSLESFTENIVINNCTLMGYYAVYGGNSLPTFVQAKLCTTSVRKHFQRLQVVGEITDLLAVTIYKKLLLWCFHRTYTPKQLKVSI